MVLKLSDAELMELASTIDKANNSEVTNVFLAIFGKKPVPGFKVSRTKEEIEVVIPEKMALTFINILDAHAINLGQGIKKRSIFGILNELKNMGSELGRAFKRG